MNAGVKCQLVRDVSAACLLGWCFAAAAECTTYYVSDCAAGSTAQCVAGDDANVGDSPSTPWRTFDKARSRFKLLAAGDQILFARGGSFTTVGSQPLEAWVNANSRANNPIVVGAYTPPWALGGESRPIRPTRPEESSCSSG